MAIYNKAVKVAAGISVETAVCGKVTSENVFQIVENPKNVKAVYELINSVNGKLLLSETRNDIGWSALHSVVAWHPDIAPELIKNAGWFSLLLETKTFDGIGAIHTAIGYSRGVALELTKTKELKQLYLRSALYHPDIALEALKSKEDRDLLISIKDSKYKDITALYSAVQRVEWAIQEGKVQKEAAKTPLEEAHKLLADDFLRRHDQTPKSPVAD